MNAYFISGLGADEQMFVKTVLPAGFTICHLNWIRPLAEESFSTYAHRLSESIDNSKPYILVGLSLGGMIAIEMNRFLQPVYTIIISSVTNSKGLPFWFKVAGYTRVYKIIPDYFYHHSNFMATWLLGAQTRQDKKRLSKVMQKADPYFVKWAIPRILQWDNQFIPLCLSHIHGTKDVILPYRPNPKTIAVEGGTHFMVYNRAAQVNHILAEILKDL